MTDTAQKANQIASNGLRFFFAPQIGSGLKPTKLILLSFVQIIAQFLATAKLIPADHRALRPLSKNDARLGEVLALAFANVRKPGTRIDQWTVFLAVNCLAALIAIMIGYTAFNLLIGTAHAFTITVTFNEPGCTYTGGGSLFSTGCANDMAQQWVDMLLMSGTAGYVAPWFAGQIVSAPVAAGLNAMFSTYSTAMLVLAGFLVMYHLLVIVAGTAHEGKFGGRMMNQVWAPIRLVAAIGMLVPLGGLNSGQYMVVQTAKMGSALASNVWMNFANSYAANTGAYVMFPTMPAISDFANETLHMLVCEAGVNSLGSDGGMGPAQFYLKREGWWTSGKTIGLSFNYVNNLTTNDIKDEVCGRIEMADPDYSAGGESFSYLALDNGMNANDTLRRDIMLAHKNAIENMIAMGSPLQELAKKLFDSANGSVSNYVLTSSDIAQFNTAVANYRSDLRAGIVNAILTSKAIAGLNMANQAMARGWVSASVWFNEIAKSNGMIMYYANYRPAATAKLDVPLENKYLNILATAIEKSDEALKALPSIATNGSVKFDLAEPDSAMTFSENGQGASMFEFFMNTFQNNILKAIGNNTGNTNDEASAPCGGPSCVAAPFKLNTGNPLGELSALGHRMITFTLDSVNKLTACQRNAANEIKTSSNKDDSTYSMKFSGARSACSGTDGWVNPTYFIIQSVVGTMLMAGITLAFILPMIPFIRFMFGIMAWILSLLETVVAIPVVALAHIKMEGEGLAGPMARTAYLLLLQLFLRPTLMVFGLILALLIFNLMIVALNEFYTQAVRSIEAGGPTAALGGVVYTVMYGVLAYAMANASFKAIDLIPNQCLQWIGGSGMNSLAGETEAATSRFSSGAGQISNAAISTRVNAGSNITGSAQSAMSISGNKAPL